MKSEAEYLFSNTSDKMTQNNDSFFNACVSLAMEELAIVTGRRDAALDIKHITGMLELCKAIGISCENLYVCGHIKRDHIYARILK